MSLLRRGPRWSERLFVALCLSCVLLPLGVLGLLLFDVVRDALPRLDLAFLSSFPSRHAAEAGILPALIGSLYLIVLTALLALPIGVAAAVYLEEYGRGGRLASAIEINIANLAGVPSIVYGLLGLAVFVRFCGMGRSLIAGACTLALLVLPLIIVVTREALRTVPGAQREAGYALGATRFQTVRQVVLPMALPGILTGMILAVARALGETAPLIVVGALSYVTFVPDGIDSAFTVLPIQIWSWVSRPQRSFLDNAAAAITVLLAAMVLLNAVAIYLRARLQRRVS